MQYIAAAATRTLLAVAATALLGTPILIAATSSRFDAVGVGALATAGLVALGIGLPIVSALLARADSAKAVAFSTESVTSTVEISLYEPKSLIRPLAYSIVMVTLGGAVTVAGLLAVTGSIVGLASPYLTLTGDRAVIGPVIIDTVTKSVVAATVGCVLLALTVRASPCFARFHAELVIQVLTRPENRLRHDLNETAQSRARVVRAFDVERRRIERDLHDAVQPQLLSVSMSLGLALAELPTGTAGREDVVHAQQQARKSLDNLQRVVRNIHPRVLIDHGLGAAINEFADNFAVPVTVKDQLGQRLPAHIETNLYFCVSELLSNVVKHSSARCADVLMQILQQNVHITVHDDGCGGAGYRHKRNGGLEGIGDRLAAVNGTLAVESPVGGPTDIFIMVRRGSSE